MPALRYIFITFNCTCRRIANPPERKGVAEHAIIPCRDIFLYLSVCNILIFKGCLADKYKNMSLL